MRIRKCVGLMPNQSFSVQSWAIFVALFWQHIRPAWYRPGSSLSEKWHSKDIEPVWKIKSRDSTKCSWIPTEQQKYFFQELTATIWAEISSTCLDFSISPMNSAKSSPVRPGSNKPSPAGSSQVWSSASLSCGLVWSSTVSNHVRYPLGGHHFLYKI